MPKENYFLSPSEFLSLEAKSLSKAANCSYFQQVGDSSLLNAFNAKRYEIESNNSFNINGHLKTIYKGRELVIIIGVDVTVDGNDDCFTQNSYKVLIFDSEKLEILRCFHFDFEPFVNRNPDEPKPSLHFQYGGELDIILNYCKENFDVEFSEDEIKKHTLDFEKLRLLYFPVCTVLLLNNIFLEFQTDDQYEKVVKSTTWNAAVKVAEQDLLLNYFESCSNHLKEQNLNYKSLSHLFYDPN